MAISDYRLCDNCGKKAFYDAKLNYRESPIHEKQKLCNDLYLDFLGDWRVLCVNCIDSHEIQIVNKPTSEDNP